MLLLDYIRSGAMVTSLRTAESDDASVAAKSNTLLLENVVPFDFTNIMGMFNSDVSSKGWNFSRDAFAAIPPYELMWCEVRSYGGLDVGAVLRTFSIKEVEPEGFQISSAALASNTDSSSVEGPNNSNRVVIYDGRLVYLDVFMVDRKGIVGKDTTTVYIAPAGAMYIVDLKGYPVTHLLVCDEGTSLDPAVIAGRALCRAMIKACAAHLALFQYGFNLFSCKNVEAVEVHPNQKLQHARVRRGRRPFSIHHKLKITVPRSSQHFEKTRDEEKLQTILQRFHTVRGHIAEYTEERKLFGKIAGRFWIPEHVRGSRDKGEITKDYIIDNSSEKRKRPRMGKSEQA